jgi:hypothetical protein
MKRGHWPGLLRIAASVVVGLSLVTGGEAIDRLPDDPTTSP